MDYLQELSYHYKPQKGWVNDPNGLIYFGGYYHLFYQHSPDFEQPWKQAMHWGHAISKDFINWQELPIALTPEFDYDKDGCWSGTAIAKDGVLYLFYASIRRNEKNELVQTVSVAYSEDGVNFTKYARNPIIDHYPVDGGPDFRDPAVCEIDGKYYCVMATGNLETKTGRLLLYKSENLFDWKYEGIMSEWANCKYTECPSFMKTGDKFLLAASVCPLDKRHYFSLRYGTFENGKYTTLFEGEVDKGPDQYAGQVFKDEKGRTILISWVPGWNYAGFAEKDVGCMSVPRELKLVDGKIYAYPVKELQHLIKTEDEFVTRTPNGFTISRTNREPVVVECDVKELAIIRDGFIIEVFVNGGESVYTALL